MSTVYLGTSAFAAAVLDGLAGTRYEPSLVVTRPDAPRGRGRRMAPPPVAERARAMGIAVEQPQDVNDPAVAASVLARAPDAIVVCAYGAIIRDPLLGEGLWNVHPSLLPRWRGAAPIERAIMAGDAQTGVSIMRLEAGLDSGPVCLAAPEPIAPQDTYGTLAPRLERLAVTLLLQALAERPPWVAQDEAGATYADKIGPAERTLDPARPAAENVRIVHALSPHIGARWPLQDGSYLGVRDARVGEDGAFEPLEVQPAGGRPMSYADYLRGHGG